MGYICSGIRLRVISGPPLSAFHRSSWMALVDDTRVLYVSLRCYTAAAVALHFPFWLRVADQLVNVLIFRRVVRPVGGILPQWWLPKCCSFQL